MTTWETAARVDGGPTRARLAPGARIFLFQPRLVAHVRAASVGDVSESNCHPFHYKNYLMLHNGGVEEFIKIKKK